MKIGKDIAKYYWYFGLLIVILFLIFGVTILMSNYFQYIPTNMRIIIGIFIISYGAFRLVTIMQKFKNKDYEDEN